LHLLNPEAQPLDFLLEKVQISIATMELLQIVQPVHDLHQRKLQALSLGTLHVITSSSRSQVPAPAPQGIRRTATNRRQRQQARVAAEADDVIVNQLPNECGLSFGHF
jgi:hypothetical protein